MELKIPKSPKIKNKNPQKKRSGLWLPEAGGEGGRNWRKGGQKVQSSNYMRSTRSTT